MKLQFISGRPVATTDFHNAKPLGMNGQLVLENWHILYELLKNNIGIDCAALLLEPQVDRQRGEVDWYLPKEVENLPKKSLSRQEILHDAHYYLQQGRKLGQYLLNSSDLAQRQKGQLLLQALQYPDEESIIATPYGPALLCWGHEPNQMAAKDAVIAAKGADHHQAYMHILSPPVLLSKNNKIIMQLWPWIASIVALIILSILPWWMGIIPIDYCRYYWVSPVILLLLLLLVTGLMIKKSNDHHSYRH